MPREVAEAWLKYLREELPTVAFKCSTQKQATNLGQSRASQTPRGGRGRGRGGASRQKATPSLAMQGSDSLGAEALLQLLKNYTRNADIKTAITVGTLLDAETCIISRITPQCSLKTALAVVNAIKKMVFEPS